MTATLQQIREWHTPADSFNTTHTCVSCGEMWPCDAVVALQEVDRLRQESTASISQLEAQLEDASRITYATELKTPVPTTFSTCPASSSRTRPRG